jgi:tRNA(Ile)-lysidine synthase
MIKVQGKIPREAGVAVSGGVDSMVALDFLSRNHIVTVYCFDHGTTHSKLALEFVADYCNQNQLVLKTSKIESTKPNNTSWEEYWRDERYRWFKTFDQTIVLGHHLDDCIETYIFNMCHGSFRTIPYRHANCIRPFRLNGKDMLYDWAYKNKILVIDDPSNNDTIYKRNYIRKEVVPRIKEVNPGIDKVVRKMLIEEFKNVRHAR